MVNKYLMGNNIVKEAVDKYYNFISERLNNSDFHGNFTDYDKKFALFLMNIIDKNLEFNQISDETPDKIELLGYLFLLHFMSTHVARDPSKINISPEELVRTTFSVNVKELCRLISEKTDPYKIATWIAIGNYAWSGLSFYKWNKSVWVPCAESNVSFSNQMMIPNIGINTLGLTSTHIKYAVNWINHQLDEIRKCMSEFNPKTLMDKLRSDTITFDRSGMRLPCKSVTVNFNDAISHTSSLCDLFTTRLTYNPQHQPQGPINDFFTNFNCDKVQLATFMIEWGCITGRSITIINGPKSSGKSNLIKLAKILYQQFAHVNGDNGPINNDIVRTFFYDSDSSILHNENAIRNHLCNRLVIISNTNTYVGCVYGGRRVHYLTLNASIPIVNQSPEPISSDDARFALSWCLVNYNLHLLDRMRFMTEISDPKLSYKNSPLSRIDTCLLNLLSIANERSDDPATCNYLVQRECHIGAYNKCGDCKNYYTMYGFLRKMLDDNYYDLQHPCFTNILPNNQLTYLSNDHIVETLCLKREILLDFDHQIKYPKYF